MSQTTCASDAADREPDKWCGSILHTWAGCLTDAVVERLCLALLRNSEHITPGSQDSWFKLE